MTNILAKHFPVRREWKLEQQYASEHPSGKLAKHFPVRRELKPNAKLIFCSAVH